MGNYQASANWALVAGEICRLEVWPESRVHRVWMEWWCVVERENAGELVDSARLSWTAKCGQTAAGVVRAFRPDL